ncbi:hypothetical protein BDV96DRAFT_98629 [Lophiotrema nucula]|uniref:Uncharacterized protein n=1 Tax=Lophiotrema nucula TaxID=690887 RepID=A0A6A5Z7X2_9PLEO|nr:hypothetical protein BDV96DRAFT_98629 [Lophiotrema nucula]
MAKNQGWFEALMERTDLEAVRSGAIKYRGSEDQQMALRHTAYGEWSNDYNSTFIALRESTPKDDSKNWRLAQCMAYEILYTKNRYDSTVALYAMGRFDRREGNSPTSDYALRLLTKELYGATDTYYRLSYNFPHLSNEFRKAVRAADFGAEGPNVMDYFRMLVFTAHEVDSDLKTRCFLDDESLPSEEQEFRKVIRFLKRLTGAPFRVVYVGARADIVAEETGCSVVDVDTELAALFDN